MTSATEELRKLLDERGVEWVDTGDGSTLIPEQAATNVAWDVNVWPSGQDMGDCLWVQNRHPLTPERAIAATLGNDAKLCHATEANYRQCKYSTNRGWCDDAPFLVWDDTGHLFITMGGFKTWDVTDDAKTWFAALGERHPYEQRITGNGSNWGEIMTDAFDDLMSSASESCTPDEMMALESHIAAALGDEPKSMRVFDSMETALSIAEKEVEIEKLQRENAELCKENEELAHRRAELEAATLGGGKLTAEQVRNALMSADRWGKPMGNTGLTNTHVVIRDDGWQAIADELNATVGNGTCEFEINTDMTAVKCSECGYKLPKGTDLASTRFCGGCGKAVKR